LLISFFVAIFSALTLYIFPNFRLGATGAIMVATIAFFVACFQAYHYLLLNTRKIEANLETFFTLKSQLSQLRNEGNNFAMQMKIGLYSDEMVEAWYDKIHKLFEKALPDKLPQLEQIRQYFVEYPPAIVLDKSKRFQEFLDNTMSTLTPERLNRVI